MKISALKKPRTVTVDFGEDGTLNVTYDPIELTPELESTLSGDGERSSIKLVDSIVALVKEWDLEDDDGTVIPIEHDRLMKLPIQALAAVVSAVGTDASETAKAQGKASAGS